MGNIFAERLIYSFSILPLCSLFYITKFSFFFYHFHFRFHSSALFVLFPCSALSLCLQENTIYHSCDVFPQESIHVGMQEKDSLHGRTSDIFHWQWRTSRRRGTTEGMNAPANSACRAKEDMRSHSSFNPPQRNSAGFSGA